VVPNGDAASSGDLFVAATATVVTLDILELDFWDGEGDPRATTVYLPDDDDEAVSVHLRLSYDLRSLRGLDIHSVGFPTPRVPSLPDVEPDRLPSLATFSLRLPVTVEDNRLVIDLRATPGTEIVAASVWYQSEPHDDTDDGFQISGADPLCQHRVRPVLLRNY